jgi:hypothetical protein
LIISNRQSAPAATPSTLDTDTDSTPPGIPQSSSDPTCRRPLQHRSLTTLLPPKDTVQPFQDGSPGALWVVGDHQSAQRTPSKLPVAIRTQPVPDTPIHLQPDLPAAFATPVIDHPPASRRHCPTPKIASHAALLIISNRQSSRAATPSTPDGDTDSTPPGVLQSSSDPTCRRPLRRRSRPLFPASKQHRPAFPRWLPGCSLGRRRPPIRPANSL